MPFYCCAGSCKNSSAKGFSLFRLPQDEQLLQKWKTAIGRNDLTVNHRLCEAHFLLEDLEVAGGRKSVRRGMVPSLFCTCSIRINSTENISTDHGYCMKTASPPLQRKPLGLRQEQEHSYSSSLPLPSAKKLRPSEKNKLFHDLQRPVAREPLKIQSEVIEVHPLEVENVKLKQRLCDLEKKLRQGTVEQNQDPTPKWMVNLEKRLSDQALKEEQRKAELETLNKYFQEDQATTLISGNSRGVKWSDETVLQGLKLRLSCGTSGYKGVLQTVAPYPSVRTLQRRVQDVDFEPGILFHMLEMMKQKVASMPEQDRCCHLNFDEMAIEERIDLDPSSQAYIGFCTLNREDTRRASKALVFQLHGIHSSWKQVVGYHFVSATSQPNEVKDVILEILRECKNIGLNVLAVVCDMGNRNVLNQLGFSCKRHDIVYSIQHPYSEGKKLYCVPDPVHLFKSMKEMIMLNKLLQLPEDIAALYGLESIIVESSHIEWLEEFESGNLLKYSPKLKKNDLHGSVQKI